MSEEPLPEDFTCLDLAPDAGLPEVERAYRRLKALYAENALATYSLFDDEERRGRLEQIEQAYRRITNRIFFVPRPEPEAAAEEPASTPEAELDPEAHPGRFLRHQRQRLGLTLKDISERTKVGKMHLRNIEEERFDLLPAPVYLRGFLTEYLRCLGLDDRDAFTARFLDLLGRHQPPA